MSALNAFVYDDAVHIFTDALWYDEEGVVTMIATKVFELPKVGPAVVDFRGVGELALQVYKMLWGLAERWRDFDRVVGLFDEAMLQIAVELRQDFGDRGNGLSTLLAGWSVEERRPVAMVAAGQPERAARLGVAPWRGCRVEGAYIAPVPGGALPMPLGEFVSTFEPGTHDGLALLEAQRRGQRDDDGDFLTVGGRAEHTIVSCDGVRRLTIGVWPDGGVA